MFPLAVFKNKKDERIPLAMVALSDAPSAQIACEAGLDAILVGDSLGNTALGFDSTLPVTMDMMAHHVGAVVRGVKSSLRPDVPIIADLPFGSYATVENGAANAARLMQLGASAIKVEGLGPSGEHSLFATLRSMGIPVMGHIGFTPQSQMAFGSVVQGRTSEAAQNLIKEAQTLALQGCFAIVLEAVPDEVARQITSGIGISTVGIGAGVGCDGQVLVWHDLVGISAKTFKLAKAYAQTRQIWTQALQEYKREVEERAFPADANSWHMAPEELLKLKGNTPRPSLGAPVGVPLGDEPEIVIEDRNGLWNRAKRPAAKSDNDLKSNFEDFDPFRDIDS